MVFKVSKNDIVDTVTVKLRKKKLDSLTISSDVRGIIDYKDTLFFSSNNPIIKIDTSKVSFVDKDTLKISYTPFISEKENKIGFLFDKDFESFYTIDIYPGALTDIFNYSNDSIQTKFRTKSIEDYGDITISVQNPQAKPVIIQLTDQNDNTITQQKTNKTENILFRYLIPKTYKIRIIYDENNNGKWDTGNFLDKKQAEVVEYYSEVQEVRANWSLNAIITIKE